MDELKIPEKENNIDVLLKKTRCKECYSVRDTYLEKVNWEKFTEEQIEEQLINMYCPKHKLSNILNSCFTLDDAKEKLNFHDKKSPVNYNDTCIKYLPTLISMRTWRKDKEFTNELVRYVLTAKGKLKKNLFLPNKPSSKKTIIKKYMKNAPIDLEFYSQFGLDPTYFEICVDNGYPYEEIVNSCFKKSEGKKLNKYINSIIKREDIKHKEVERKIEQDNVIEIDNKIQIYKDTILNIKSKLLDKLNNIMINNPDLNYNTNLNIEEMLTYLCSVRT
jgi:hypothetical protein